MGTISATAAGGTISVGRPGREFMCSGSVTMNAATTFAVEFNGNQYDQLFVAGSVALNGAVLSVAGDFPPNQPVTILDNDSNDAVIGTFAGLPAERHGDRRRSSNDDLVYGRRRKRCRSHSRGPCR